MNLYQTKDGTGLERGAWHNFGGPCSYRVAPVKNSFTVRHDASGEIARPRGPAGRDTLMMAMYRKERAVSYEYYVFGPALMDEIVMQGVVENGIVVL